MNELDFEKKVKITSPYCTYSICSPTPLPLFPYSLYSFSLHFIRSHLLSNLCPFVFYPFQILPSETVEAGGGRIFQWWNIFSGNHIKITKIQVKKEIHIVSYRVYYYCIMTSENGESQTQGEIFRKVLGY